MVGEVAVSSINAAVAGLAPVAVAAAAQAGIAPSRIFSRLAFAASAGSSCAAEAIAELEKRLTVSGFPSAAVGGHTLTVSWQHGVD